MSTVNFCVAGDQEPQHVLLASTTAEIVDQLRNRCLLQELMTAFVVWLLSNYLQLYTLQCQKNRESVSFLEVSCKSDVVRQSMNNSRLTCLHLSYAGMSLLVHYLRVP